MFIIQRKVKRHWANSNMIYIARFHLMTYINLILFLGNPEAD